MATSEAKEIKKQETLVRFSIISYKTRLRVLRLRILVLAGRPLIFTSKGSKSIISMTCRFFLQFVVVKACRRLKWTNEHIKLS